MYSLKRPGLYIAAILAIIYSALALAVNARFLTGWDRSSIEWLQDAIPRFLDLPFSILSFIGSFEVTVVLVFIVLFFLFRPRYRMHLFVLFLGTVAFEWLGKQFISQPGAGREFNRTVRFFRLPSSGVRTPFSFPSGHAARSAFISVLLLAWIQQSDLPLSQKRVLVVLVVVAELVMLVSRVYLGEHWSSDVIGGALLGTLCALPALADNLDPSKQRL